MTTWYKRVSSCLCEEIGDVPFIPILVELSEGMKRVVVPLLDSTTVLSG